MSTEFDDLAMVGGDNPTDTSPSGDAGQKVTKQDETAEGDKSVEMADSAASKDEKPAPEAEKSEAAVEEKPKSRAQQRIESLSAQVSELKRQLATVEARRAPKPRQAPLDRADFPDDNSFTMAAIKRAVEESQATGFEAQTQAVKEQAAYVEQQLWEARASDFASTVNDFEKVAYSDSVTYSTHGLSIVRSLPDGPKIAYHLGSNPEEAYRIARLGPIETAVELGRIAERLNRPARTVTGAPPPIQTVKPKGGTGFKADGAYDQNFEKWMQAGGY